MEQWWLTENAEHPLMIFAEPKGGGERRDEEALAIFFVFLFFFSLLVFYLLEMRPAICFT